MSSENNQPLNDDSPFPYGIHEGVAMKKIPVNYYHYLYVRGLKNKQFNLVADYIRLKIPQWKTEHPGYSWD